jgi:hypothetical protein
VSTRTSLFTSIPSLLSCGLLLAATSCSGQNERSSGSTAELKAQAEQALSAGERHGDPCAEHGWYSDGECDTFCADRDADCAPADEPVACTLILEVSNGVCSRPESDPCRFQDPDCVAGSSPTDPGRGVACAAFLEVSDGVCSRPKDDPCKGQDPDCIEGGDAGGGTVCALYVEISDGVCSRPADDPCKAQDPDCTGDGAPGCDPREPQEPVVCALFIEQSDGVCSRPADDPCKAQDPDCTAGSSSGH